MAELGPDEVREWNEAFNDHFTTTDELNQVVVAAFNLTLDQVALGDDLLVRVDKLIQFANAKGWLDKLIAEAHAKRPHSLKLTQIFERFQALTNLEPRDCFEATRLRSQIFVNRRTLRDILKRLEAGSSAPVLIVEGGQFSGKSYSSRFINYLADKRRTFTVVQVDLERLAKGEIGPVKPATVARRMVDQLGLKGMPEPGLEQDATWVDQFCDWLTGALRHSEVEYWIVIDGFGSATIAQATDDLIQQLGLRSFENLGRLRLVLLSYGRRFDLEAVVRATVEYEWIAPITRHELTVGLTSFFSHVHLERRVRLELHHGRELHGDENELQPRVVDSVKRVLNKVHDDDPRRLVALRDAVALEAKDIYFPADEQATGA